MTRVLLAACVSLVFSACSAGDGPGDDPDLGDGGPLPDVGPLPGVDAGPPGPRPDAGPGGECALEICDNGLDDDCDGRIDDLDEDCII